MCQAILSTLYQLGNPFEMEFYPRSLQRIKAQSISNSQCPIHPLLMTSINFKLQVQDVCKWSHLRKGISFNWQRQNIKRKLCKQVFLFDPQIELRGALSSNIVIAAPLKLFSAFSFHNKYGSEIKRSYEGVKMWESKIRSIGLPQGL